MTETTPPQAENPQHDRIVPIDIEVEMRASYLDYAMSVIIGRALPDVRDGLKPVHRRVLFAMHDLSNTYNRPYKKSARIVGDVIGKYHPHGDVAVYDTIVRMAQDFSMRHVLVDGQGNFGSLDNDPPAAMRYTEVRMARLAQELLNDIEKDTVDFEPNYDESLKEPVVLPARFPNLLVNGSSGIAVGMATNIPPHNLAEVIDATVALARDGSLTVADLMKIVPGPDFPTGALIYGAANLRQAYETGRGVIQVRGRAAIEENKRGEAIVVSEVPYQINKAALVERIADLVRDKRIEGISEVRDESGREGLRVVVEIKRDANAEVVLNQLYANTPLQSSFGINMVAIVGGQPRTLSLRDILRHFVDYRREVVTRRSRFELKEARARFNIVFGLLAAVDAIDRVIAIIRGAKDSETAKAALMAERLPMTQPFKELCDRLLTFDYAEGQVAREHGYVNLNEFQAQAILDMRLARLTGLERSKLEAEAAELQATIVHLLAILASDAMLNDVVISELLAVKAAYADPRRTELVYDAREMSVEDLIKDEDVVVTMSHAGYVKRSPVDLYRTQRRGGRGKTAATTRDEDFVETMFVASTHSYVLIFTDKGKVYWLKVHEIPPAGRTSRGKPIVNLIRIAKDEKIAAVLPVREFTAGRFLVMMTQRGYIKKTDLMSFGSPRPSGLIALSIDAGDALIHVDETDGSREIILATRQGMAIRFPEANVRPMGRTARGVRAIHLKKQGDGVVGAVVVSPNAAQLLTVCDRGYGKRTAINEYRLQSRGGSGTINCKITDKNGPIAGVCGINADDQVMLVTDHGMMIRIRVKQISQLGRATQGVRLITLAEGESLASVARIAEREEEDPDEVTELPAPAANDEAAPPDGEDA